MRSEAVLDTLTLDVVQSNRIEGEMLDRGEVRSSIARRLGLERAGLKPSGRKVDGMVEVMLDATQHYDQPLTRVRLFGWHSAMFHDDTNGNQRIRIGTWRTDEGGPMQVVSGPMGHEKVHYTAPPAASLDVEMDRFLSWFNSPEGPEPVLKSGVAHLWFLTLHPFDDGNGRIARVIADMLLARADGTPQRFYSMTDRIERQKKGYYTILEDTQKGGLDITSWLQWYLDCLLGTLEDTGTTLGRIMGKAKFWQRHAETVLNDRQQHMLNRLLDGLTGKLTTSKWAKLTKTSSDTALRDIRDLIGKSVLEPDGEGGRNTGYRLREG